VRFALALVFVAAAVGATTTSGNRIPTVGCDTHITFQGEGQPPRDALVLGRVEMPRPGDVLQLGARAYPGAPRLAKRGISVTAGSPVVLEVPRRLRRVYGLTFGDSGGGALGVSVMRIRPCAPTYRAWTSWAGGYLARKPACVTLFVHAEGRTVRVPLNIGRKCARIAR
jgi:hypothetical protein